MRKSIYDLKLHEIEVISPGSISTRVQRVPGGWNYMYDTKNGGMAVQFVPFNNEFETANGQLTDQKS